MPGSGIRRGERLHILLVDDGDGYSVQSAASTDIRARGVFEGLCL